MEKKLTAETVIDILKEELDKFRERSSLLEKENLDLRIENLMLKEELEKANKKATINTKVMKSSLYRK